MAAHLYSTLNELFPLDIIHTILPYADNALIIDMQDYFPKLLKNISSVSAYGSIVWIISHGNNSINVECT